MIFRSWNATKRKPADPGDGARGQYVARGLGEAKGLARYIAARCRERAAADAPEFAEGHKAVGGPKSSGGPKAAKGHKSSGGPKINARFLAPYFEAAGLDAPPEAVVAVLCEEGWPVYRTKAEAKAVARQVAGSGLFDAGAYAGQLPEGARHLDPALHYVLIGEQLGLSPSSAFDPAYYADSNPDVVTARLCRLGHYAKYGRDEDRRPLPLAVDLPKAQARFSPGKETVILVSHQASRTGAPIVALNIGERLAAKYNVITFLLDSGELDEDFEAVSTQLIRGEEICKDPVELKHAVRHVLRAGPVRFAVVNSFVSAPILPALADAFVPSLALIHEFTATTGPVGHSVAALGWVSEPVFSSPVTAASFRERVPVLMDRRSHVLPQGRCRVPGLLDVGEQVAERQIIAEIMRPAGHENSFVVLGAGSCHLLKGVDIFIATASVASRLGGDRPMRFVWIGDGFDSAREGNYSGFIAEQIARSRIGDSFAFVGAVSDLNPAYAMADAFYLSSRLDPLPNVTVDAGFHGLPVVCFEDASGFADILQRDALAVTTVVPYLDAAAAAERLSELARDEDQRQAVGAATEALTREVFDFDRYVAEIDRLGTEAVEAMDRWRADFETIVADPAFDVGVNARAQGGPMSRQTVVSNYLANWLATRLAADQIGHRALRRPCPGFHPQIYARHHPALARTESNPFADYLRNGSPEGPWTHEVVWAAPSGPEHLGARKGARKAPGARLAPSAPKPPSGLKTAIHAHFHYPELIEDFLEKLAVNEGACDLLLSTDDDEKADMLAAATARFAKGRVRIRVGPNRGRDIGPFLTTFAPDLADYDIVGHVHAKRSIAFRPDFGETWREFLWQHLIGGLHPAMDIALSEMSADPKLGLFFAEDPYLVGWDDNLDDAEQLAVRCGIGGTLPASFEFPTGTMFWARPAALKPLLALGLDWTDYPAEPLPYDGTILHAIERLLPFAAKGQGFGFATFHIPEVSR